MNKKKLTIVFALLVFSLPLFAIFDGKNLSKTLHTLRYELRQDFNQISISQERLQEEYNSQHKRMVDIIKQCNELSLLLYSQKQEYTFDLSFALQKVTAQYNEFNKERTPYDRIANNLSLEIDRYARLLESLRRLPPERETIETDVLPDSLLYRNDTLDMHLLLTGTALDLQTEVEKLNEDSSDEPFVLDSLGEEDRDSCIFYASELLKMFADSKAIVVADSIHYKEAYLRLKESYDYARDRYRILQTRVFVEGQVPWMQLMADYPHFKQMVKDDLKDKYDMSAMEDESGSSEEIKSEDRSWGYFIQVIVLFLQIIVFLLLWALAHLVVWLVRKFSKSVQRLVSKEQKHCFTLLLAVLFYMICFGFSKQSGIFNIAFQLTKTFLWLFAAILASMLIRLDPSRIRQGLAIYRPTIFLAMVVIGLRIIFAPNSLMNFVFPPILAVFFLWQLFDCLRLKNKILGSDRFFGWMSLLVNGAALGFSIAGYIFIALLILVWWYFQIAAILTVNTVWYLLSRYRDTRMTGRLDAYRARLSYVPDGPDKETLMFGGYWFYSLIKDVVMPSMVLLSIPFCLKRSLNVFDFDDLFVKLYINPFINLTTKEGLESFRLSFQGVIGVLGLFFIFKYLNNLVHYLWKRARYASFMKKNNRTFVRQEEMNLVLGNSIISVLMWMLYVTIVVMTLRIPTGFLGLVAGGLSAGIGLALKDILNNFIYGLQLMSGRLKVGDWIECDGVRGTVTGISYQSTQVQTEMGTSISFLNATLFGKSFINLTRGNDYEFTKILVGVSYGTDIQRLREVLEPALQSLRTKDAYGREVVDPKYGIYVRFGNFGDSAIEVAVKQYVLVPERITYTDRAKELIYNTLTTNGFHIPFPQCDIHVIKDDSD